MPWWLECAPACPRPGYVSVARMAHTITFLWLPLRAVKTVSARRLPLTVKLAAYRGTHSCCTLLFFAGTSARLDAIQIGQQPRWGHLLRVPDSVSHHKSATRGQFVRIQARPVNAHLNPLTVSSGRSWHIDASACDAVKWGSLIGCVTHTPVQSPHVDPTTHW